MAWYVAYDTATGRLESESDTEIAARTGKTVLQLADRPNINANGVMWDESTRTFIARPLKVLIDRLEDIQTNPNFADFMTAYNTLSAANKTRLRNMVIRLLGSRRWRNQNEPVELD
jgi:hypothetical protein